MKQDIFWPSFGYFMRSKNKNWTDRVLVQAIAMLSTTDRYSKNTPDEIYDIVNKQTAEVESMVNV